MRTRVIAVLCLVLASSSLALAAPARPAVRAPARDRQVFLSIKELMDSIIDPSADVLWGAAGTVVDKDGIHDLAPKTDDAWHDVRRGAVRIVEGANLLMMPVRAAAPPGTKSDTPGVELEPSEIAALMRKDRRAFDAFARALQGIGMEALKAIDAKDIDTLMDLGARMDGVCESCHQTFWYPSVVAPQAGGQ